MTIKWVGCNQFQRRAPRSTRENFWLTVDLQAVALWLYLMAFGDIVITGAISEAIHIMEAERQANPLHLLSLKSTTCTAPRQASSRPIPSSSASRRT